MTFSRSSSPAKLLQTHVRDKHTRREVTVYFSGSKGFRMRADELSQTALREPVQSGACRHAGLLHRTRQRSCHQTQSKRPRAGGQAVSAQGRPRGPEARALHARAEPLFRASQLPGSPLLGRVARSCVIGLCEVTRHLRLISLRRQAGDSDAGMGTRAPSHGFQVLRAALPPRRLLHLLHVSTVSFQRGRDPCIMVCRTV